MNKAYIAFGERPTLICAYDKSAAKALKRVAKLVEELQKVDEFMMLTGVNVAYDDDANYHITATASTTNFITA